MNRRAGVKNGLKDAELRFLFLSPASRQALLGMRALALLGPGMHQPRAAAAAANLPANMLSKVFQKLGRAGLLSARRGPGGGYALSLPPEKISLSEILHAVRDVLPGGKHCLIEARRCGEKRFCVIHNVITKADKLVDEGFASLTLSDLVKEEML
jgi:Rrf2 family protein